MIRPQTSDPLNRVLELNEIATTLAPAFTSGMDFSERGPAWGNPNDPDDYERLVIRSYRAAEAFLRERDKRMAKATDEMAKAAAAKKAAADAKAAELAAAMAAQAKPVTATQPEAEHAGGT